MKLRFLNRILSLKLYKVSDGINGITSLCEDGFHVLFFDYDNVSMERVIKEVKVLIEEFELSDCYLFKSSEKSFHVICLDKFDFGEVINIHKWSSHYDMKHDKHSLERGFWVLRFDEKRGGDKPEYVGTITSLNGGVWDKSNVHKLFLEKYYGLRIGKDIKFDLFSNLLVDTYRTVL